MENNHLFSIGEISKAVGVTRKINTLKFLKNFQKILASPIDVRCIIIITWYI